MASVAPEAGTAYPPGGGAAAAPKQELTDATRSYVRGSGVLLGGRFISIFLNLLVQVLTVRYLAKADYGAFAYGLGVASIGSSVVLVGLGKAVPRFVPLYSERGDHARAFGTVALAVATVTGVGLSLVALLHGLKGVLAGTLVSDPLSLALLLVLIALAPINALDHLLQTLVAVFISARAIFFRRYVLAPLLKLAAIVLVIAVAGDVYLLAYGYIVGGALGLWLYVGILLRKWRSDGVLRHLHPRRMRVPAREVYGFSLPLLSAELPVLLRGSIALVLLEYYQGTLAVAEYRAVYPVAGLNLVVFQAFGFLFMPMAARMFARNDGAGISELFWQSALWITVLTFPVFAVTCLLAEPVAVMLFGARYASAGTILSILAVGYFVNAALGYNAAALQVLGKVRFTVFSDILAAVTFIGLCVWLIPLYGAVGAAIGTTVNMVVHNIANHVGFRVCGTGIQLVDRRFVSVYVAAASLLLGLMVLQWITRPPVWIAFALVGAASLLLVRQTRHLVNARESFPELLRIPLIRWLMT